MADRPSGSGSHRVVKDGSGSEFDRLFSLLGDQRRRFVLYYLQTTEHDAVAFDELATNVAEWESGPDAEPTEDLLEDVAISLHHHHLPKLASHGIVDYDERSETVRYWDDLSDHEWIDQARRNELEND